MITCIAIDDEPLALWQLVGFIEEVPYLKLLGQFYSAIEALDFSLLLLSSASVPVIAP